MNTQSPAAQKSDGDCRAVPKQELLGGAGASGCCWSRGQPQMRVNHKCRGDVNIEDKVKKKPPCPKHLRYKGD